MRAWRGEVRYRKSYDGLRRLTASFVERNGQAEIMSGRVVYGESHTQAAALRLRNRVYRAYDGAGESVNERFDFKGNLLKGPRRLVSSYSAIPDWNVNPALEQESFVFERAYDALNRSVWIKDPSGGIAEPQYGESGLLNSMSFQSPEESAPSVFVQSVRYDARGRRQLIEYGNGVASEYFHDSRSTRVTRLRTSRAGDSAVLQDLNYFYDPVGNILEIRDEAQRPIFFHNAVVTPDTAFVYDPLYRLTAAEGREHAGQNSAPQREHDDGPRTAKSHPHDGQAMRRYTRTYEYDATGNIVKMAHQATGGNWTARRQYDSANNRLAATSLPGDPDGTFSATYDHDALGNMIRMPHLASLRWDHDDRLREADLGGGGTAYYGYDGNGERVRKVVERPGGLVLERISLGEFEVFRERKNGALVLERITAHVSDNGGRIALVDMKTFDAASPGSTPVKAERYQLSNNVGSCVLELDSGGAILSYEEFYPFGSTSYQAGPSVAETSLKRYRYCGKERDEETSLYYYGARYYAPWLGRWTATDPAGLDAGANLYQYGLNNPIRFLDPDGRDVCDGDFFCRVGASVLGEDEGFTPLTAVSDNLARRGEAFANTPSALKQVYEEKGALGVAGAFVEGAGHLVKQTGEAGGQMFYVALNESGEDADYKLAHSATDFVLGIADITMLVDGAQSGAKGLENTTKALVQDAKALAKGTKPQTAVAVGVEGVKTTVSTGEGVGKLTGPAAQDLSNVAKGTAIMMVESKNVTSSRVEPTDARGTGGSPSGGSKPKPKPGPGNPSAKGTAWETRYHSADRVPYAVTGPHSALHGTSVYILKDAQGNILYVGKGYSLDRLRQLDLPF